MFTSNLTYYDDEPKPIKHDDAWRMFMAANAVIFSVLAVTFNSMLILVIVLTRSLRTPTNTFIVSLAIGEILVGLFHIPFVASSLLAKRWPFSDSTCRASATLHAIGRTAGTFSLMSVCVDRCVAVSRPLMYTHIVTFKFAATMLSSVWLLAITIGALPLGAWGSYGYSGSFYACIMHRTWGEQQHLVKEFICTFAPCLIIAVCLIIIIKDVKYHHRVFALFPVPTPQLIGADGAVLPGMVPGARSFNRNTMKALRPLFVMCLLYGLFCLPATGLYLSVQRVDFPESHPAYCLVVWLSFLSAVLNPVVVILFKRKFRSRVRTIFQCHRLVWSPSPNKEPFTISSGLQGILLETTLIGSVAKSGKGGKPPLMRGQSWRVGYTR